ncbi:hypothetical protein KTD18_23965 [Burkholderia multivorans]|uniref:hypothetical protein n=1 Tax=Burkholderia multivorans TaxID=87883 RepID=UPI0011B20384|nr:hypothetical protein [Burkholderia multivorans]MBU9294607.1 hypothetical protein [Burkholderia multivorans]
MTIVAPSIARHSATVEGIRPHACRDADSGPAVVPLCDCPETRGAQRFPMPVRARRCHVLASGRRGDEETGEPAVGDNPLNIARVGHDRSVDTAPHVSQALAEGVEPPRPQTIIGRQPS